MNLARACTLTASEKESHRLKVSVDLTVPFLSTFLSPLSLTSTRWPKIRTLRARQVACHLKCHPRVECLQLVECQERLAEDTLH